MLLRSRSRGCRPAIGDRVVAYLRPEDVVVLQDGEGAEFENVIEGTIERVIFEGPTAQLRVDIGGRELRADISGGRRLLFAKGHGRVRLGFNEVTLIVAPSDAPVSVDGADTEPETATTA